MSEHADEISRVLHEEIQRTVDRLIKLIEHDQNRLYGDDPTRALNTLHGSDDAGFWAWEPLKKKLNEYHFLAWRSLPLLGDRKYSER